jgi:hypothetical protein
LHWRSADASRDHAFSNVPQPRSGLDGAAVFSVSGFPSTPEHLTHGTGSRPDQAVEVLLIDQLTPYSSLAAKHKLGLLLSQICDGVVTVDELPALGRATPVVEGVVSIEGWTILKVKELATSAIKVLCS